MNRRSLLLASQVAVLALSPMNPAGAQRLRLSAGLTDLEAATRKDSNDAAVHYNVALGYWNEKRFDDVEKSLRLAVQLDPQFAAAYLALAYLPYARRPDLFEEEAERRVPEQWKGPLDQSDRDYRRAFLVDPLVDLRIIGAVVPRDNAVWGGQDWLSEYIGGLQLILQGKYKEAHVRFHRAIDEITDRGRFLDVVPELFLWYHAVSAAQAGLIDEASEEMERLLHKSQNQKKDSLIHVPLRTNEFRYVLAVLEHRAGRLDNAERLYRHTLQEDLGIYMAHVQLARIYEANRLWDEAARERQSAVNANPEDASLLYDLGVTLAKGGRFASADSALNAAAKSNPRDARIAYYQGMVAQQLARNDFAREAFNRFLALAPSRYTQQIADARRRLASLQ